MNQTVRLGAGWLGVVATALAAALLPGCQKPDRELETTLQQARAQGVGATLGTRSAYSLATDPQPRYYVDAANGDDNRTGTDPAAPLRSIGAALGKLAGGGGTVYCTGTFRPASNVVVHAYNDGTSSNWLLLRDWPGQNRPVLDGGGANSPDDRTIYFGGAEYTIFQGFEVTNARSGITSCDVKNVRFLDNEVHNISRQGISAWGCQSSATYDNQNVVIDGNTVYDAVLDNQGRDPSRPGWESGIILSKGQNGIISNNRSYHNYGEGIIAADADRIQVRNNTSWDNFSNYLYLDNSSNCVFERNLAYNTGDAKYHYVTRSGIVVPLTAFSMSDESRGALGTHVDNNVVRNNILINGGTDIILSLGYAGSTSHNNKIVNNTCYSSFPGKGLLELGGGSHDNLEIRNNVFRQVNNGRYVEFNGYNGAGLVWGYNNWFGGDAATLGAAAAGTDVNADPLLANPTGGFANPDNFKVAANSPVVDRGYNYGSTVPTDFFGTARPAGNGFDIGAHEQAGGTAPGGNGGDFAGYYQVVARHSGKALDVQWGLQNDRANVWQYTINGTDPQLWRLEKQPNGYYRFTARHSGKVLDVDGAGQADGTNVQQYTWNASDAQLWRIESVGGAYYKIVNKGSGKVLDVKDASTADEANVQQWTYGGGFNQQWELRAVNVP